MASILEKISKFDGKWHSLPKEEVLKILKTGLDGLSSEEVKERKKVFGKNVLEEYRAKPLPIIFFKQFADYIVLILLVAATISLFLEEYINAALIALILVINAFIGTYQEWKAEKAIVSLRKYVKFYCKVKRNGVVEEVLTEDIVPGDIVILEQGSRIPADLRLIESINLEVDESILTGESIPVEKDSEVILDEKTPLSDRINMAYTGTLVTYGYGVGVVVATGKNTELGKIARLVSEVEVPETPLKRKTKILGRQISNLFLIAVALVFIESILRLKSLIQALLVSLSLAVAVVPEGLPVFITLILAIGALEMAKRRAIVRNLEAVETLGSTTVICSDKTGTLTENQMTVVRIVTYGKEIIVTGAGYRPFGKFIYNGEEINPMNFDDVKMLILTGYLCNRSELREENGDYKVIGDPLEGALIVLAKKAGIEGDKFLSELIRVHEIPFDSRRKRMSTIYLTAEGDFITFIKGSPESILEIASRVQIGEKVLEFGEKFKKFFHEKSDELASRGLKVLAFGYKRITAKSKDFDPKKLTGEDVEKDIVFLGIVGMIDPPRRDSKEFIKKAKEAGIKVIMVTGDHALTAKNIAKRIGIIEEEDEKIVIGTEIEEMDENELIKTVEEAKVFARITPEGKLKIVEALKKRGDVIAMTGDGVNDAPALKRADVGIAMGKRGTDVAREASDVILVDEKFSTIVRAIEVGRIIRDNIRKTILYLISSNIAEVLIIFLAYLFFGILALLPIQILWINLVSDGLPALGLCVDPPDRDVMKEKPRDPDEPILRRKDYFRVFYISLIITLISLALIIVYRNSDEVFIRSILFTSIVLMEFYNALNMRSEEKSILEIGLFSNKYLLIGIISQLALQMAITYLYPLPTLFQIKPLPITTLITIFAVSSIVLIGEEIRKFIVRRK